MGVRVGVWAWRRGGGKVMVLPGLCFLSPELTLFQTDITVLVIFVSLYFLFFSLSLLHCVRFYFVWLCVLVIVLFVYCCCCFFLDFGLNCCIFIFTLCCKIYCIFVNIHFFHNYFFYQLLY